MMTLVIPTIIGLIAYILLYFTKWRHYQRTCQGTMNEAENVAYTSKITMVITTCNQAEQLKQLIERLLKQTYSGGIEIVVVCYATTDNTLDILKKLEYDHRNIRHIIVPASAHFIDIKKLAITIGIKSVRTEWFTLLTPNFSPDKNDWLTALANNIKEEHDLILGYENFINDGHKIYALQYSKYLNFIQSQHTTSSIPPNICNFIIRKNALELTKLYDDHSLQYNLGSISKLLSPIYVKNTKYFCLNPEAICRLQISKTEIGTLNNTKEAERKLLFKVDAKNTTLKVPQSLLIYLYVATIFVNATLLTIFLSAFFFTIHPLISTYINASLLYNIKSCLISGISTILQIAILTYPILLLKKNLKHFNIRIPTAYLFILPITLPINELFYKIKSLFLKNIYRRKL
jgi:glycosyltransferase involved in cell wall biosynthesis